MKSSKHDYRYSHTEQGYGKHYHESFITHRYRKYIWDIEKVILVDIIRKYKNDGTSNHLDFACGTGRVLTFLENYCTNSTGVDISDSMLEIAESEAVNAKLISGDITKSDLLANQTYDLISAFRFFLRAQPSLKNDAMAKLVSHLDNDGYLVFNIHNNKSSISNNISKLYTLVRYGRVIARDEMSHRDVRSLVHQHGLSIVDSYAYGTYPVFREDQFFPEKITRFVDKYFKNKYLSTYVIYVCQKKNES